jgi:hypothetical protein
MEEGIRGIEPGYAEEEREDGLREERKKRKGEGR